MEGSPTDTQREAALSCPCAQVENPQAAAWGQVDSGGGGMHPCLF